MFKLFQNCNFLIHVTYCEIALRCRPHNPIDESTMVQVMAWCRQATNHYLSHCWPRSMSPYGVIMPQWVDMCVYISNTFMLLCIYGIPIHAHISWSIINWYPDTPHQCIAHTHDLALFHQILLNRELSSFPSLLCLSFYIFLLLLFRFISLNVVDGNFAYVKSALLPWDVSTSVIN